ncbi:MAG: FecR family protein [Candidatus Cryptobacteroides sp.]
MTPKQIIQRYFSAKAGKDMPELFEEWFSDSHYSEQKELALKEIWDNAEGRSDDIDEQFNKLSSRIRKNRNAFRMRNFLLAGSIAAGLALPLAVAGLIALRQSAGPEDIQIVQKFAANGKTETLLLPDSTTVILNSGSTLLYPSEYNGKERTAFLSGEAIFKVAKNKEKPFIVKAGDINVRVLGTEFDLRAYPDERDVELTVNRGCVQASGCGDNDHILNAGDRIVFDKSSGTVRTEKVEPDKYFAWKDGKLYFSSESFRNIVKKIEQRYGVDIYVATDRYDNERITAKFISGEGIEELMGTLQELIPGLDFTISQDGVIRIR